MVIPAALGLWFAVGVAAGIVGIKLSHPGLAHWGVAVLAASVSGTATGMLLAARCGQAHKLPIAS